jgi:hypothetical protein
VSRLNCRRLILTELFDGDLMTIRLI